MSVNIFSQRLIQSSARRRASPHPHVSQLTPPVASPTLRRLTPALSSPQIRLSHAGTSSISATKAQELLAAQRRSRPVSPHLSIYRPQITWYGSALNRITGSVLSGGLYVFGFAYLVAPAFGWHLETASMAAAFAAWPIILKIAAKFTVALPFTYHSFNGLRHLMWDSGAGMTNKQVVVTGWTVVGVSVLTAFGLTFY